MGRQQNHSLLLGKNNDIIYSFQGTYSPGHHFHFIQLLKMSSFWVEGHYLRNVDPTFPCESVATVWATVFALFEANNIFKITQSKDVFDFAFFFKLAKI